MIFILRLFPYLGVLRDKPGIIWIQSFLFSLITMNLLIILSLPFIYFISVVPIYFSYLVVFIGAFLFSLMVFIEILIKNGNKKGIVLPFHILITAGMISVIVYIIQPVLIYGLTGLISLLSGLIILTVVSWGFSELMVMLHVQIFILFARYQILGKSENQYQMEEWIVRQNLGEKLNEFHRYGGGLSLMLIGLDLPNKVKNENFIIELIYRDVRKIIRNIDIAGRTAKGKMIAMINHTNKAESIIAAKRILSVLKNNKKIFSEYDLNEKSIIIGIQTAHGKDMTAEKMMEEAKKAFQKAKETKKIVNYSSDK